jgi:predicted GIY-YIG superfamily endonuclease
LARRALPKPIASGVIENPDQQLNRQFVYRVYCRCDEVLYVGLTSDPISRLAGHTRGRSSWTLHRWGRVEWDAYKDRATAAAVEERLIRDLTPLYNVTYSWPRHQWVPLPDPFFLTEAQEHQRAIDMGARRQPFHEWLFREGGPASRSDGSVASWSH